MSKSLKKLIDINRLREFKNKLVGTGSAYVQTAAVDQTVAGTKTFSKPIVGSVTGSSGSCTGNAASANIATKADYATKAANADHATSADSATRATSADRASAANCVRTDYSEIRFDWDSQVPGYVGLRVDATDMGGIVTTNIASSAYVQTGAVDQTVAGTKTFSKPIVGSVTGSSGSCTGNAASANIATKADSATKAANADHATKADYATKAANADHATSADSATRATSADRASAANCVRTDYSEIRFDWASQVPDHVGLRVDATDMGGIVTTNRLVSDIRAQWYAAYPDGAEAHNATWGGRDITAAFNNGTVSANIANGSFKDIFPGDYITKQVTISGTAYTVNWVVADCDYWWHKGDQNNGMETHHVVIVPQAPIFDAYMNVTNNTEGGYADSRMYTETIPACATGIVSAFGSDHILTFRDGITNSVDTSHVSSGIPQWTGTPGWWGEMVSVQCNLMSEKMVYGAPICAAGAADNIMASRQMSAFRLSERLINYNRNAWWLRDVVSSARFAFVGGYGDAGTGDASGVRGVRPFALLV